MKTFSSRPVPTDVHVIADDDTYVKSAPWIQTFCKNDLRELRETSKKFVSKRLLFENDCWEDLLDRVLLVLYSEMGKFCGAMVGVADCVDEKHIDGVRHEIATGLAALTIVLARLASMCRIGLSLRRHKLMYDCNDI